jgi:hypothetical protein
MIEATLAVANPLFRQVTVRAVAKCAFAGMLAAAPRYRSGLRQFGLDGLQAGAFVRAVAKRLLRGSAATAPPIGAWVSRQDIGTFLYGNGLFHEPKYRPSPRRRNWQASISSLKHGPPPAPDSALRDVYEKIRPLLLPPPEKPKRQIGFHAASAGTPRS